MGAGRRGQCSSQHTCDTPWQRLCLQEVRCRLCSTFTASLATSKSTEARHTDQRELGIIAKLSESRSAGVVVHYDVCDVGCASTVFMRCESAKASTSLSATLQLIGLC